MQKSIHTKQYAIFLKVLRDARRRAGLTQEDVADRIGETQSFVSKVERGERRIDVVELHVFCVRIPGEGERGSGVKPNSVPG
jgi:ribosome-binding protein aMBF1 (putative translation factor)